MLCVDRPQAAHHHILPLVVLSLERLILNSVTKALPHYEYIHLPLPLVPGPDHMFVSPQTQRST